MKNVLNNVYFRKVLFEKFNIEKFKNNSRKEILYYSIVESQKEGRLNEEAFEIIFEIINIILKNEKFSYIDEQTRGDLFHCALVSCVDGFKNYRNNGHYLICYNYFISLINKGIFSSKIYQNNEF